MRRLLPLLLLVACGGEGEDAPASPKPGGEDSALGSGDCVTDTGGGYPTWAGFGEAFFAGRCASCHAASAPERFGAPESVTFDSEEEVLLQLGAVRRVILYDASMPPGGGLHEDELARVELYLDCLATP